MEIEEYFKSTDPQSVLFVGRVKNFTIDEIKPFLKQYNLSYTQELNDNVSIVIESSMQTPLEEEIVYEAYKKKIPIFKLEQFEELYSKRISANSILMSVKLSNDQDRIVRLLKNESFDSSLYLKLFKMYDWGEEGIYDNDKNRDVTISFIKRFYQKDRFMDPSIIYSPVTLSSIIMESTDAKLLDAVLYMPNYDMHRSKRDIKKPKNLRELVAANQNISKNSLKKLLNFNDREIDYFLASNPSLDINSAKEIFKRSSVEVKAMLAHNEIIDNELFKELLASKNDVVKYLLAFQPIDYERLKIIDNENLDDEIFAYLGENLNISYVLDELLNRENIFLSKKLASNSLLNKNHLEFLDKKYSDNISLELSLNPNLPNKIIQKLYQLNNKEIDKNLAANRATPQKILKEYFEKDDFELNSALASNESLDLYYLQQLQLDTRLMNILSKNRTFTKNILNNLGI